LFLDSLWQVIDNVDGELKAADHGDYEQEDLNEDVNMFEIEDVAQEQMDDEAINADGVGAMFAGNEEGAEYQLELDADEPMREDEPAEEPLGEAMDAHLHDIGNEGPGHRYNLRRQPRVDYSSMFASAATMMTADGSTAGQRGESASGGASPPTPKYGRVENEARPTSLAWTDSGVTHAAVETVLDEEAEGDQYHHEGGEVEDEDAVLGFLLSRCQ
jgi:hypothetical protein